MICELDCELAKSENVYCQKESKRQHGEENTIVGKKIGIITIKY